MPLTASVDVAAVATMAVGAGPTIAKAVAVVLAVVVVVGMALAVLSVWGQEIFFCIFIVFASGVYLKGTDESFLLSEDEPLTPNIDGVVAL